MKKHLIILGILILGIALIFGIIRLKRFLQIDTCLDNGGRWNYATKNCEEYYNLDTIEISKLYWHSDFDEVLRTEFLIKGEMLDSLSKSPNELIEILNRRPANCKIEFQNLIGDTLIIRITNDEILSEQMGTTGAECFIAETVYTLTENDLIKFVRFEMEIGSHAKPGLYSRNDFKQYSVKK
jgi:hypothetical protein